MVYDSDTDIKKLKTQLLKIHEWFIKFAMQQNEMKVLGCIGKQRLNGNLEMTHSRNTIRWLYVCHLRWKMKVIKMNIFD